MASLIDESTMHNRLVQVLSHPPRALVVRSANRHTGKCLRDNHAILRSSWLSAHYTANKWASASRQLHAVV